MSRPYQPAIFSRLAGADLVRSLLATILLAATVLGATGCERKPNSNQTPLPSAEAPRIAEADPSNAKPATNDAAVASASGTSTKTGIPAPESAPESAPPPEPEPVTSESSPETAEPTESADTIGDPSNLDKEQAQQSQPATTQAIAAFRLLLPTTAGPLLVDLDINIGDQPLSKAFQQRIETVIEQAGGADSLTWNALFAHIEANPQLFGLARIDSQQYRNMIQMYDRNRNMRPEPDEVAHFLFRDSGFSGPFRLVGSNHFRQTNRTQSPMLMAIDRNSNHRLEADEIEQSYQSLMQLDRNGDRRIDVDEIMPPSRINSLTNDAWSNRHQSRWGDVAMDLGGYVDWSMVSYSLEEASRQGVFHEGSNAIARLDQNGDDSIDGEESRGLLEVPADIRLQIRLADSMSSEPQIEVAVPIKETRLITETMPPGDRARIASDRFQLIATVRDLRVNVDSIPPEAFEALDADKDGGLDPMEIPAGALREYSFEELDQNEDGKLTHRELIEGMNPPSPVWSVQVRARGAETPDAVFAWLDQDQNGLLSTRELRDCRDRLRGLASKQGEVVATDIPDTFVVQFGRGDPLQDATLFSFSPSRSDRHRSWPRWAESMDSNQDGDIAREEFLGESATFDQLDRDGDDFLGSSELE